MKTMMELIADKEAHQLALQREARRNRAMKDVQEIERILNEGGFSMFENPREIGITVSIAIGREQFNSEEFQQTIRPLLEALQARLRPLPPKVGHVTTLVFYATKGDTK